MKQENVFENMKLNKSEIVKQRVGEGRHFVRKLSPLSFCSQSE